MMLTVEFLKKESIYLKKDGLLSNYESIGEIMRKVSRSYNVEIVYQEDININQSCIAVVSRYDHVFKVLRKLEKTGGIHSKSRKKIINAR